MTLYCINFLQGKCRMRRLQCLCKEKRIIMVIYMFAIIILSKDLSNRPQITRSVRLSQVYLQTWIFQKTRQWLGKKQLIVLDIIEPAVATTSTAAQNTQVLSFKTPRKQRRL